MADSSGNLLLDLLPAVDRERLLGRMDAVPLAMRDVLAEPGRPMPRAYFPVDGIISILTTLNEGQAIEAASVGWEGMAGIELFLGGEGPDNVRLVCQVDGKAWAMDSAEFRAESRTDGPLREVMERYARTILVQTTQSAACNGAHTVEERLAKWLSLISGWLKRSEFPLTHDFAAALLGVHRPSVTLAAGTLHRAGILDYRRGQVRILDTEALHDTACECYGIIRQAYLALKVPLRGDGPGAVLRFAAAMEASRRNCARGRAEVARSAALARQSTKAGRTAMNLSRVGHSMRVRG